MGRPLLHPYPKGGESTLKEPEPIAYSVHEAAHVMGLTESAVRSLIIRKMLPVRRVGGRVLVLRDEIIRRLLTGSNSST